MRPAHKTKDTSALYVVFLGLLFGGVLGWIFTSNTSAAHVASYRRNFIADETTLQSSTPVNLAVLVPSATVASQAGEPIAAAPTVAPAPIIENAASPSPTPAAVQPTEAVSAPVPVEATTQTNSTGQHPGDTIHTLFTSNGSPYQNFQGRIMYGTYKLVQKMPGGEKLTGFTRILHRTQPDGRVMDEIPSFRANPLQPACDNWCEFPVADRANAVQQWIDAAEKDPTMIKGAWLLMLESDYVWMKPLQAPGSAYDPTVRGISFAFDYINPKWPGVDSTLKLMCPECDVPNIPNSGPAPVLMRFADLKACTPYWVKYTDWIETNKDAKTRLGWVREMYAWSAAVAITKSPIQNIGPPTCPLIAQPPHDLRIGSATMFHYTWGVIYKNATAKTEIWKWDKRFYTDAKMALAVPQIEMPPPWQEGIVLQDGLKVSEELHNTLADMLRQMNAAIVTLEDLSPKT